MHKALRFCFLKTPYVYIWGLFVFIGFTSLNATVKAEEFSHILKTADSLRSSDPQRAIKILKDISAHESKLTDEERLYLKYLEGYMSGYLGQYEKAISLYTEVLSESKNLDLNFRTGTSLVNIYALQRKYTLGLQQLESDLKQLDKLQNTEVREHGLGVAAIFYNQVGMHSEALKYANILLREAKAERNQCVALHLIKEAHFYLETLNFDSGAFKKDRNKCYQANEKVIANHILATEAKYHLSLGDNKTVVELLSGLEAEVGDTKYTRLISEYNSLLSTAHFNLNNYDASQKHAKLALENMSDASFSKSVVDAFYYLSLISEVNGQYSDALEYHKKYTEAENAYIDDITAKQFAYQYVKQQTSEKIKEIKLLNKQNEVLKLEQDLAKQEAKNHKLIVLLLTFFLATLAFWAYRVKRNHVKLKRQSEIDVLTGVSSRHHFYYVSRKTLELSKNAEHEVSFILFDMDGFKSVNDNYGHLVGDWVLKKAVEVCRPCWRSNDIVGRLGGEEFAIMLPNCDLTKAVQIAEASRQAIEAIDTSDSGHIFKISASFGVTTSKVSGHQLQELIADADRIMYQAKAAGKNQVLQVSQKQ
ncbi:diguanylate cyclase [Kangiella sp. TOML190]|uniref:GGDEF domain-containing protein n=1 Tax=Kangiella sp. TOML190 TaxID=2931351 RepID=UPI00203C126A|nr:diguanylate cyclase [Kangiella sp. TOML190]